MASSLDEEGVIDSVQCTDETNAQALLCISGYKALEDGAAYVVYRGLSNPTASPRLVMRTFSVEDEVAPVACAQVKEANDVKAYEESLTYQPHSSHKVVGTTNDFIVVANGNGNDGLKFCSVKRSNSLNQ